MRHLRHLRGETLITDADCVEAREIRAAWHRLTHVFDKNLSNPATRARLTAESWSDSNFALQLVGIKRCQGAVVDRGVDFRYGWAACRDAYDFTPEPVYQYNVLSALLGLWIDTPPAHRRPQVFERIVVRQTHGWAVNGTRAEPMAFDHPESRCGWILVPFVWDDLYQLAFEAWMKCLGIDPTLESPRVSRRLQLKRMEP